MISSIENRLHYQILATHSPTLQSGDLYWIIGTRGQLRPAEMKEKVKYCKATRGKGKLNNDRR